MADEQIRIDVTAEDDASKVLEGVADEAEKLERLEPKVEVSADTAKAEAGIEDVTAAARELSRQDTEIVLRARVDDAKGALASFRAELDQTGEKAEETARKLDRVGDDGGGLKTRGNAIADLTGPLGEASSAASDFAGVFDGIGDIAEDVAGKVGLNAAAMSTAIGGIGIAVAAGAAAWSYFSQRAAEAKRKQEEIVREAQKIRDAIKQGNYESAAEALVAQYGKAYDAARQLGLGVDEVTSFLRGQADAMPGWAAARDVLNQKVLDSYDTSKANQDAVRQEVLAQEDLVRVIYEARDANVAANGTAAEQEQLVREVTGALGGAASAHDKNTRAMERADRQARITADGLDGIQDALDIEQAALDFRQKLDYSLADTRTNADRTSAEILQIKQDILDVAAAAGLSPIEVRTYLDRIDQGDVDGVMLDVNHKLANRSAEVQTSLKPPTQADYAQMARTIQQGMGIVQLTVALNAVRSGAYGNP